MQDFLRDSAGLFRNDQDLKQCGHDMMTKEFLFVYGEVFLRRATCNMARIGALFRGKIFDEFFCMYVCVKEFMIFGFF